MDRPALERPVGTDHQLVKRGPIQIATVQGEPLMTQDGIPVLITAKIAWSNALCIADGLQRPADRLATGKSPGKNDDVSPLALTREALRKLVPGCGLAALLCERHGAEEQLRLDVARRSEASGLVVHLARIRTIDIPASVQAAGDAQALLAMRACVEGHRIAKRDGKLTAGATAIGGLTC